MRDIFSVLVGLAAVHALVFSTAAFALFVTAGRVSISDLTDTNRALIVTLVAYYTLPFLVWAFKNERSD